ncbi:MAG: recombinase family protein [Alphaproteobacteria bacterium]|nr:recombinase family protein [Alphaproteobacteria bacterium]
MLIGYMRVSKADGTQAVDLQLDALLAAGVDRTQIYEDRASGARDDRPGLASCLKALRDSDVLVIWRLDRLGRSFAHLIATVTGLEARDVGLRVLTGEGAMIDTTTPQGRMLFRMFSAFAEFERELIRERTRAGLAAARARGRTGGRPAVMTRAKMRLAQAALVDRTTNVRELCAELGISPATLYRHLSPAGDLRARGRKVLEG